MPHWGLGELKRRACRSLSSGRASLVARHPSPRRPSPIGVSRTGFIPANMRTLRYSPCTPPSLMTTSRADISRRTSILASNELYRAPGPSGVRHRTRNSLSPVPASPASSRKVRFSAALRLTDRAAIPYRPRLCQGVGSKVGSANRLGYAVGRHGPLPLMPTEAALFGLPLGLPHPDNRSMVAESLQIW